MKKNSIINLRKLTGFFLTFFCLVLVTSAAEARDVTFSWSANAESVDGYQLYYKTGDTGGTPYNGTGAIEGNSPVNTGNVTTFTLHGLADNETYHFALTAFSGDRESDYSTEQTLHPVSTVLTATFSWSTLSDSEPLTVRFDATDSTGPITTYKWEFNDGRADESTAVTAHRFPAAGTYKIILTIGDASGGTVSISRDVTVTVSSEENEPPHASLEITSGAPVGEAPLTVSFDAGGSSDPENSTLKYSWDFGDGTTAGNSALTNHIYTTAGTYTAKVTVTDSQEAGNTAVSQAILVTAGNNDGSATAVITASSTSGTAPMVVNFSGAHSVPSAQNGTISVYTWNFADGSTGSGREVRHVFSVPGQYAVQLTITDSSGNQDKTTTNLTVSASDKQNITPNLVEMYSILLLKPLTVARTIDNGQADSQSSGPWKVSTGTNYYGTESEYSFNDASYSYKSAADGMYTISLWWTEHNTRCTDVPVKIYDGTVHVDTVIINQQHDSGQWNELGTYNFTNGSAKVVIVSTDGSCSTNADAVRFVPRR